MFTWLCLSLPSILCSHVTSSVKPILTTLFKTATPTPGPYPVLVFFHQYLSSNILCNFLGFYAFCLSPGLEYKPLGQKFCSVSFPAVAPAPEIVPVTQRRLNTCFLSELLCSSNCCRGLTGNRESPPFVSWVSRSPFPRMLQAHKVRAHTHARTHTYIYPMTL